MLKIIKLLELEFRTLSAISVTSPRHFPSLHPHRKSSAVPHDVKTCPIVKNQLQNLMMAIAVLHRSRTKLPLKWWAHSSLIFSSLSNETLFQKNMAMLCLAISITSVDKIAFLSAICRSHCSKSCFLSDWLLRTDSGNLKQCVSYQYSQAATAVWNRYTAVSEPHLLGTI